MVLLGVFVLLEYTGIPFRVLKDFAGQVVLLPMLVLLGNSGAIFGLLRAHLRDVGGRAREVRAHIVLFLLGLRTALRVLQKDQKLLLIPAWVDDLLLDCGDLELLTDLISHLFILKAADLSPYVTRSSRFWFDSRLLEAETALERFRSGRSGEVHASV